MFVLQFSVGEVALGDVLANEVGETPYYYIAKRLLQSMGFLPDICDSIKTYQSFLDQYTDLSLGF